jgi:hypothetical protein
MHCYRHNLFAIQAIVQKACLAVVSGSAQPFTGGDLSGCLGLETESNSFIEILNSGAGQGQA